MLRLDRASSNQLFETLADWEIVLQGLFNIEPKKVPLELPPDFSLG